MQQIPSEQQDHLAFGASSASVLTQMCGVFPYCNGKDILEALSLLGFWHWHTPADVPELPEIGAALISWKAAPEEFARHFVVKSHHVGFDEAGIRLEQGNCVWRDLFQSREQCVLEVVSQGLIHGLRKLGSESDQVSAFGIGDVSANRCQYSQAGLELSEQACLRDVQTRDRRLDRRLCFSCRKRRRGARDPHGLLHGYHSQGPRQGCQVARAFRGALSPSCPVVAAVTFS